MLSGNEAKISFIPSTNEEQTLFMERGSETQDFLMRAWMTGIILAIFGLWLATI